MSFTLHHAIVHQLLKEQHIDINSKKPYNLRTKELDHTSPIVIKLSEELLQKYGKQYNTAMYGSFDPDKTRRGKFPDAFQTYHGLKKRNSSDFIKLSSLVMNELVREADKIKSSSGGYILFLDYSVNRVSYLVIAMIKQKDALTITDTLNLEELLSIDLSKLHQATKINFKQFSDSLKAKSDDDTYLSFVSPVSNGSTSGYFITALGCQKNTTASKMTTNLIKSSESFFKNDPVLKPFSRKFKDELIKYLSGCCEKKVMATLEKVIDIAKVSINKLNTTEIDAKANELVTLLNSDSVNISANFNVNKKSLNNFIKVKLENDDYTLNFTSKLLGITIAHKVFFDEKKGKHGKLVFDLDESTSKKVQEVIKNK